MPSVGLPPPRARRSALSRPRSRRPAIALAADPTPGRTARSAAATARGIARRRRASAPSRPNAATTERTFPAPYSQTATFTRTLRRREARALDPNGARERAADGLERRLGDVVVVAAVGVDVDREPPRLREAAKHVLGQPRVALEVSSAAGRPPRSTARPCERVVHRDDGVAVARDPAAVAERPVERLAERERGVLGRVVVAGLEVADPLENEIEAGMERELLEQVVVHARAGADATRPHRRDRGGRACASRPSRAGVGRAACGRGDGRRPVERARERLQQEVVVGAVANVKRIPSTKTRTTIPRAGATRRAAPARPTGTKRKFVRDGSGASPSARSARAQPLALLHLPATSGGSRSATSASAAEIPEIGCGAWRRFSSAAVSASASAYPTRAPASPNDFENVRRTTTPSSMSAAAVSPAYSKYASSTTSGRASGSSPSSPVGLFGRQQNVTDGVVVADLGAGELRGDADRAGTSARRRSRRRRPAPRTSSRRAG